MLISFILIIISTSLSGQPSPRFYVEAWLPFRNREMKYLPIVANFFSHRIETLQHFRFVKPFLLSSNICNPGVVGVPWYFITELRGGGWIRCFR